MINQIILEQIKLQFEFLIVHKTIDCILGSGHRIIVADGTGNSVAGNTSDEIMSAMFIDTYENILLIDDMIIHEKKQDSYVHFIYNCNGHDVIANYTLNLENIIAPALALARDLESAMIYITGIEVSKPGAPTWDSRAITQE